jgi:hypothetical protein
MSVNLFDQEIKCVQQKLSQDPVRTLECLAMQEYYHGDITREEAEAKLVAYRVTEGSYLVRLKDTAKSTFALSIYTRGAVEHHLVQVR